MNPTLHESLSLLAAEFRGVVKSALNGAQSGRLTADEALAAIKSEYDEYSQLVQATWSLYSGTGGESR